MTRPDDTVAPAYAMLDGRGDIVCAGQYFDQGGITKREHFACEMMKAILSNPEMKYAMEDAAHDGVRLADYLIAELNKEESK